LGGSLTQTFYAGKVFSSFIFSPFWKTINSELINSNEFVDLRLADPAKLFPWIKNRRLNGNVG